MTRARDAADILSNRQECTAWCSFNGSLTGTNAPLDGFNVTSVTRNSTGNYTIAFANALDNTYYAVASSGDGSAVGVLSAKGTSSLTIEFRITTTANPVDLTDNTVIIFGGKG